jgi:two-component system, chemotaxis family, CheB/CheR fusion protein
VIQTVWHVVWNRLSNAVKFTPTGGHVTVRRDERRWSCRVARAATGQEIPHAFLPFVFAKSARSMHHSPGSTELGRGLVIAPHLIELHGGSIEARSEGEGDGATFVVRRPLPSPGVA